MPRYVVQRTIPAGLHIPIHDQATEVCRRVTERNAEEGVTVPESRSLGYACPMSPPAFPGLPAICNPQPPKSTRRPSNRRIPRANTSSEDTSCTQI